MSEISKYNKMKIFLVKKSFLSLMVSLVRKSFLLKHLDGDELFRGIIYIYIYIARSATKFSKF
jgi:hypothetical protein